MGAAELNISGKCDANLTSPTLVGVQEFDRLRNAFLQNGKPVGFCNPIKYRETTKSLNVGINSITDLPADEPIHRLWLLGATPGNITHLEVYQDNNLRLQADETALAMMYQDYGFQFGRSTYLNRNLASNATLLGQFNPINYFDAGYLPDMDGRLSDKLYVGGELLVKITSAVQQSVNIVIESAPGAFK